MKRAIAAYGAVIGGREEICRQVLTESAKAGGDASRICAFNMLVSSANSGYANITQLACEWMVLNRPQLTHQIEWAVILRVAEHTGHDNVVLFIREFLQTQ